MKRPQRAALAAGALLGPAFWFSATAAAQAPPCELSFSEHRSGRELLRLPMPQVAVRRPAEGATVAPSGFSIRFTHSVLGTPVEDRYEWRRHGGAWRAHLVEERFEGQGYGLPYVAEAGQALERDGDAMRLRLDRQVHPLVVRPLPALAMRVIVEGSPAPPAVMLGALTRQAVELRALGCGAAEPLSATLHRP